MNSAMSAAKPGDFFLNAQSGQAGTNSVVLQGCRCAEHGHDAVSGELVHRAAVAVHHQAGRLTSSAMISRSRSAPTADAMSIECTTSANNTVTCLYSADRVAGARAVPHSLQNLAVGRHFRTARPTDQPRRGQSTTTIPAGVHVSIVSLLVSRVRHIAAPPLTRSQTRTFLQKQSPAWNMWQVGHAVFCAVSSGRARVPASRGGPGRNGSSTRISGLIVAS